MFPNHNDIRNYVETESPHSSKDSSCHSKKENVGNVSESAAFSSTTNYARSSTETSLSQCVPGKETAASTSDVDTSFTVHKVRTTTECEEIVREMFPFLELEEIKKTLIDCNMNVEVAISTILGEKGMCHATVHYRILVGKYLVLTVTCYML